MNKLINLLLLVVMFFSIAHGVVLNNVYEDNHCSVQEYVAEFSAPHADDEAHEKEHHNGTCETHFMFHLSFLLPDIFLFSSSIEEVFISHLESTLTPYAYQENTFRPPIV